MGGLQSATRSRGFYGIAAASCLLLSSFLPTPVAHADDVSDITAWVNRDRLKTAPACPPLKTNGLLNDIALAQAQLIPEPRPKIDAMIASYKGDIRTFIGVGDPLAAARTDAYDNGARNLLGNCEYTEIGASFYRFESEETDWVGIVFGKPLPGGSVSSPPAENPPGGNPPPPPGATKCPAGGPKAEVPAGEKCPPPANAVSVSFSRGFGVWTVNVRNSAGIGGSCVYTATSTSGLTGANKNFNIGANGNASFQVPAPLPFTTYHVVTSCTGTYDGQQVEFGHDEQDVSL